MSAPPCHYFLCLTHNSRCIFGKFSPSSDSELREGAMEKMCRKNSCPTVSPNNRYKTLLPIVLSLLVCQSAFALQPVRFNYQAKLTAQNGAPISGSHTVFLSLWDGGTS